MSKEELKRYNRKTIADWLKERFDALMDEKSLDVPLKDQNIDDNKKE